MFSTRRFLAAAVLGVAGMAPTLGQAQSDPGADDLRRRLRGAPGSRVGGATRGVKRDQPNGTGASTTTPATVPATTVPARVATSTGG